MERPQKRVELVADSAPVIAQVYREAIAKTALHYQTSYFTQDIEEIAGGVK